MLDYMILYWKGTFWTLFGYSSFPDGFPNGVHSNSAAMMLQIKIDSSHHQCLLWEECLWLRPVA